jgi:hypothetical protein
VLEKSESSKIEGLSPVVSSKAKRLHRSRKGLVFNFPPKKAITVTGMQWTSALLTGLEGTVKVAIMSWWTTRGDYATQMRKHDEEMFGKIHGDKLQALCVRSVLAEVPGEALVWIAVDATPVERPEAQTSQGRGYIHVSNLPLADKPISIGWMFSVVGLLPEQASSWTPPLDFQRISSEQTAVGVAI